MSDTKNLFEQVDFNKNSEEFMEILARQNNFRIERIVSQGHASPENFWYDQDEFEWVAVLQGEAELEFKDYKINLKPGDYILIEPHELHRVSWTSSSPQCVWLAVFFKFKDERA